ncbi:uncharacterized protein LOC107485460 [Arachis duranensis]|uniref:Uncharacterized protein LOC107485460 n=1 Tax=Arachis duranensis TaxID=130453 RepID=A0A9C6THN1_ARADU|nr:uncharacterized protein LOC107485460 [Arachis duranensis]
MVILVLLMLKKRDILEELHPGRNLKELSIDGYRDEIFPDWLALSCYSNITKLSLRSFKNRRQLPSLGQLPALQRLVELSSGVPENMLRFIASSRFKILSSSNGLLLCVHRSELFIINPATCYLLYIPLPNHLQQRGNLHSLSMTLECDSDDYRLILFDNEEWSSHFDCHVYSHKQGAWSLRKNRFFAGSRNLKFNMPVICNGAIHFISDCYRYLAKNSTHFRPYIMSYEISNGDEDESVETKLLRVPKEARKGSHDISCRMSIFKWGEVAGYQTICLVRLRKRVFTVWILTNYESNSWRRILKVRVKGMGLMEQHPEITGFTVLNGDLVFATKKKIHFIHVELVPKVCVVIFN